jgi:hypothetical protein
LFFDKTNARNKKYQGKIRSILDLNGVPQSRIVQIHEATCKSLKISVGEMESENATLKDVIRELNISLIPQPIFSIPITTMQLWKTLDETQESSSKLRGTSILLAAVIRYVGENMEKKCLMGKLYA